MKLAYVILHYMAGKDTIECAKSILTVAENSEHEIIVIIVDNGSTNDSYEEIKLEFQKNQNVVTLHSNENLGFSKGNNLGFYYAKQKFHADFIVQLNNDTIISQKDFNEVIIRKFEEKKYSVLGPDIVTSDGFHQNPGNKQCWSLKELKIYRIKKWLRIILSYLSLDTIISNAIESTKEIYRTDVLIGDTDNTILHGACWIFSPLYIDRFEGNLGQTFLYWEEDILKLYADFYGFLMTYSSDIYIYHKEDIATNMLQGSSYAKARRKYLKLIQSSKEYGNLKKKMEK